MGDELKVLKVIDKELRRRNLTWPNLARMANVNYTTLQNWRDERNHPTNVVRLKKVADALGLSLHYLCYGREEDLSSYSEVVKVEEGKQAIYLKIKFEIYRDEENNGD